MADEYFECPTCKGWGFVVVNDSLDEDRDCPNCDSVRLPQDNRGVVEFIAYLMPTSFYELGL